jgi:hypothetical protein
MTPEQLDDYLERARLESGSMLPPDGFTDRVMRAVAIQPAVAPVRPDFLPSTVASGALIVAGALLAVSPGTTPAAIVLFALGLMWSWLDDPIASEIHVRLLPW